MNIAEKIAESQNIVLWELQEDEDGNWFAIIDDEELDFYKVEFNYDNCAKINFNELTHIVLNLDSIYRLALLLEEAEELLDFKYNNDLDDEPLSKVLELFNNQ
jgi:hypothetical protein